ncbi:MAG: S1 family peptidase, partial [Actinomycetota bacterium]|nr:S1 family peptidase [Actinomycetota bacterium]
GGGPADSSDLPEVARLHGITRAEAAQRLAQERFAGALEADARRLWPDTFAGLWMGRGANPAISVAFTADAAQNVAQLGGGSRYALQLQPVTARHSDSDLKTLQRRMIADREAARRGEWSLPGISGASYALDIDPRRNAVVLIAARPTAALVAAVRERYGDAVVVESGAGVVPGSCTRETCLWTLRSGLKAVSETTYCSTAFAVRRNDTGARNILSAAHCSGNDRYHGGQLYGQVLAQQQAWKVDAERHGAGQNQFAARAYNFVDTSNKAVPVTSTGTYAGLNIDATVCKSGVRTGKSCGVVKGKDYSPYYVPNGNSFIRAINMCSRQGDSGSGVYIDGKAVGILSGVETDDTCFSGTDTTTFGHIEFAQSALGATVVTSESRPTFDSIVARNATSYITVKFGWPVSCASVSTSDFTVKVNGLIVTPTFHTCDGDSDPNFDLQLSSTLVFGSSVEVTVNGTITDPGGNTVPTPTTRTTTVS